MRSGQLRHKLWVQVAVASTADAMGGVGQSYWEDGSQIWGHLQPLSGTEKLVASQMATEEDCKIHLRYSTELTPKARLRLADTTTIFDVVSVVNPDYRNRELILYCRKEV